MIVRKAREIRNAKIEFISLVDRAANKKQFLITKSAENTADFLLSGRIIKADSKTHHITGIVYEPMSEDAHGDFMTEEEIQKAAYWFAKNGDKVDRQHNFETLPGTVIVENWVTKSDTEINGQQVRKGTWLITVEVDDPDVWESVCKGEITGFSMGGVGEYAKEETNLADFKAHETTPEKAGVLKKLAGWLGLDSEEDGIQKAGRKMSGKNYDALKQISTSLNNFIAGFSDNNEMEEAEMTQEDIQTMVDAAVAKALEKEKAIEKSTKTVATAEIEKMVDRAVEKVFNSVQKTEETPAAEPALTAETIQEMVNEAVKRALKPEEKPLKAEDVKAMISEAVTKAVEPVLKARGVSSNLNEESAVEKKEERHYLAGIL